MKKLGTDLPAAAVLQWKEWCEARGLVQARATVAAFTVFQSLPLPLRELAMNERWNDVADRIAGIDFEALLAEQSKKAQHAGRAGKAVEKGKVA